MLDWWWKLLNVEPGEKGQVGLLLLMSFLMGLFIATVAVASQSLFFESFDETHDLPIAIVISGGIGIVTTLFYSTLQGRISFIALGISTILFILLLTGFIELGEELSNINVKYLHAFGFTLILPFHYLSKLVFWGSFGRLFDARAAKRVIGSVDLGMDVSSILGFFAIPVILESGLTVTSLYTIALISICGFLMLFLLLAIFYFRNSKVTILRESEIKKLSLFQFFGNKYIRVLAAFIIISLITYSFIEFSFFNVTVSQFDSNALPYFLSFFEGTIVVFSFIFTISATDKINKEYGLKISMLVTPVVLLFICIAALLLGSIIGFDINVIGKSEVIYFFLAIAMSKLYIDSMSNAIDEPTFKFFYVPLNKGIKIDVQTKIEGVVMATGSTIAGAFIVAINQFEVFNLLSITSFTIFFVVIWILVVSRMHAGYLTTLWESLKSNSNAVEETQQEYSVKDLLKPSTNNPNDSRSIISLRMMKKIEPAMLESTIDHFLASDVPAIRNFANEWKNNHQPKSSDRAISDLAKQAALNVSGSDIISVSNEKLQKLSKSASKSDRILVARILRHGCDSKSIFMLLELLRDSNADVRTEAILTARELRKPETFSVLIELLGHPRFVHHTSEALEAAGKTVLPYLENAFHKSGQLDDVIYKIIDIIGNIGTKKAFDLLWKKIDHPDQKLVNNILKTLCRKKYQAKGQHAIKIIELLEIEMSRTMWNLAALDEMQEYLNYKILSEALQEEIKDNYHQIMLLLSINYEPNSVQLVKENLEMGTPDSVQYAIELLDLFLDKDLKPKLIPLLDDSSIPKKKEKLLTYFPRERYTPVETINFILNRDYNASNRWTRACALFARANTPDFDHGETLISHIFNADRMLQETAAWALYHKNKDRYQKASSRLNYSDKKFLDASVQNNLLEDGLEDGYFLQIEIVFVLQKLDCFSKVSGKILSYLSDVITPIHLKPDEAFTFDHHMEPFLITAIGEVELYSESVPIRKLKRYEIYGDLFTLEPTNVSHMKSVTNSVVFKINATDFYYVLSKHSIMIQQMLKVISLPQDTSSIQHSTSWS